MVYDFPTLIKCGVNKTIKFIIFCLHTSLNVAAQMWEEALFFVVNFCISLCSTSYDG